MIWEGKEAKNVDVTTGHAIPSCLGENTAPAYIPSSRVKTTSLWATLLLALGRKMGISRHDDGGREESSMDMTQSSSDDKPHLHVFSKIKNMLYMFVGKHVCVCVCELTSSLWPHRVSYESLHIHSCSGLLQQTPPEFSVSKECNY